MGMSMFATDAAGDAGLNLWLPALLPIGTRIFSQSVHVDPGAGGMLKITVSNGLQTDVGGDTC